MNRVSVVIPTNNRKNIISNAIGSVLEQTHKPYEIIVVDDGSTDGTEEYLATEFPDVIVLRNEVPVKGAKARNQGAARATGEFVAFLDSDDQWLPEHLEDKIKLINDCKADGAFGEFYLKGRDFEKHIKFNREKPKGNIANKIFSLKTFDCRTSTFVFRKVSFDKVKFDENLAKHQDWDLALNFADKNNFACSYNPTVLLHIEHGEERMSHKLNHDATFYFLRKNIDQLDSNNAYFFCVKQYYYCLRSGDVNAQRYLDFVANNGLKGNVLNQLILNFIKLTRGKLRFSG